MRALARGGKQAGWCCRQRVTLLYLSGSRPVLLASGLWLGRGQKRPDDGTHFLQSRFPHQLLSPKSPLIHGFLLRRRPRPTQRAPCRAPSEAVQCHAKAAAASMLLSFCTSSRATHKREERAPPYRLSLFTGAACPQWRSLAHHSNLTKTKAPAQPCFG